MRFLRTLVRLIEGILLLLIPLALLYWFLLTINLDFFKPIVFLLGKIFNPFINIISLFVNCHVPYEDKTIDMTPLAFACFLLLLSFVFYGIEKIINNIELFINRLKIRAKKEKLNQEIEAQKKNFFEALAKNKVTYLVVKFSKIETSYAYLYNNNEDFFSEGVLNSVLNGLIESVSQFNGKKYSDFKGEDGSYNYVFYEITDGIDFVFNVHNRVLEINHKILDESQKLYFTASFNCGYSEEASYSDILTANKILNLAAKNQILVSKLFKDKYEAVKNESNIKFLSKGLYNVNENQVEVFELKVTPAHIN